MVLFNPYLGWLVGWLVGFYGISTFVGYVMPNPFLLKQIVLFKTNQFSISKEINCKKIFLFHPIQFSQTVLFQLIQFNISTQFSSIWPIDRALSGATTPGKRV